MSSGHSASIAHLEISSILTHWLSFLQLKIPCFPYDYPDSKAYSSFMTEEAAVFDNAAEYRPAAKRPPRVPLPPWHCIMASLNKEGMVRCLEADDLKPSDAVLPGCFSLNSNSGDSCSSPTNVVASFQLFVPRTFQMLRHYVKELDMMSLSSSSEMKIGIDEPKSASGGTVKIASPVNGLCLVRVLIRAFKEGSFEEGAVVCAPFSSDLTAWKTRYISVSFIFADGGLDIGATLNSSCRQENSGLHILKSCFVTFMLPFFLFSRVWFCFDEIHLPLFF